MNKEIIQSPNIDGLYSEISGIIIEAKNDVKITINISMVTLYWNIGNILSENIINGLKPEYGKILLVRLVKGLLKNMEKVLKEHQSSE